MKLEKDVHIYWSKLRSRDNRVLAQQTEVGKLYSAIIVCTTTTPLLLESLDPLCVLLLISHESAWKVVFGFLTYAGYLCQIICFSWRCHLRSEFQCSCVEMSLPLHLCRHLASLHSLILKIENHHLNIKKMTITIVKSGKVPVTQAWWPELNSQNIYKNSRYNGICLWFQYCRGWDSGILGLSDQPTLLC